MGQKAFKPPVYTIAILILILIASSLFCYSGSIKNHILEWDDQVYIRENPYIKGFSTVNILNIFTRPYFKNYTPLHLLSYIADNALWKDDYKGYHCTNLLLHILNGILLFLIIYIWTRDPWIAFLISIAFALHPINVESVAWLSERKGLLAALFFLSSILCYTIYKKSPLRRFYLLSLALFLLAALSKPIVITLPLCLILYDMILLRTRPSIPALIPFFGISLFSFAGTLWAQRAGGGIKSYFGGSAFASLLAIPSILFRYIARIVWPFPPIHLSCRYVLWPEHFIAPFSANVLFPWITLIAVISLLAFLCARNKANEITFGIAWFFVILLPVLNIIPTSTQMADRYVYIAGIGIYLLVASLLSRGIKFLPVRARQAAALIIPAIVVFSLCMHTKKRVEVWQSDRSLWEDALNEEPKNYYALTYLANYFMTQGREEQDQGEREAEFDNALRLFRRALEIQPDFPEANLGLGTTLIFRGDPEQAMPFIKRSLEGNTEPLQYVRIYNNLGIAFLQAGDLDHAIVWFNRAIEKDNGFLPAYLGLGHCYVTKGDQEKGGGDWYEHAADLYTQLITSLPDQFKGYFSLAVVRERQGRTGEAIALYKKAASLPLPRDKQGERADALINLAIIYQKQGEAIQALALYREALKAAPDHSMAGQIKRVILDLESAITGT